MCTGGGFFRFFSSISILDSPYRIWFQIKVFFSNTVLSILDLKVTANIFYTKKTIEETVKQTEKRAKRQRWQSRIKFCVAACHATSQVQWALRSRLRKLHRNQSDSSFVIPRSCNVQTCTMKWNRMKWNRRKILSRIWYWILTAWTRIVVFRFLQDSWNPSSVRFLQDLILQKSRIRIGQPYYVGEWGTLANKNHFYLLPSKYKS